MLKSSPFIQLLAWSSFISTTFLFDFGPTIWEPSMLSLIPFSISQKYMPMEFMRNFERSIFDISLFTRKILPLLFWSRAPSIFISAPHWLSIKSSTSLISLPFRIFRPSILTLDAPYGVLLPHYACYLLEKLFFLL